MRRLGLLLLLALAAAAGCSQDADAPVNAGSFELLPVPEPDLESMDAPVREAIVDLRREAALGGSYGDLGRMYYAYGMQEAAEACFRNAGRLAADDFVSPYFLALIHLERGQLDEGAQRLRTVLELRGDYTPARVRLGKVLVELGDADAGRQQLEQALTEPPFAAAAHYSLGKLAAAEGDQRSAVEHFEQVLALQPEATRVHYPLGQAYRKLGETENAARHVEASGERDVIFPDPVTESLRQLTSGAADLLNTSGRAFFEGEFAAAATGYRQALEIAPDNVEAHKGLALTLERLGDLAGAEEQFREARRLSSDDPDVERGLGLVLQSRGALEEALTALERAVELDPGSVDSRLALAGAFRQAGRSEEALQRYDDVLQRDPLHRGARVDRATTLHALGRTQEALSSLQSALDADPGHHEAAVALGALLARGGRPGEAEIVLTGLLERDPPPPVRGRALFNLGVIESMRGNEEGSRRRFGEALEIDPDLGEARLFFAAGLARAGRFDEAAGHLKLLVDREPLHLQARLAEATALVYAGRHGEAKRRLEEGLVRTDGEPVLALALAKLLATSPTDEVRDGAQALSIAQQLYDALPGLEQLEVLAMAHAETGDFTRAVTLQRQLVARAAEMGEAGLVRQFERDLARYQRNEPSRGP